MGNNESNRSLRSPHNYNPSQNTFNHKPKLILYSKLVFLLALSSFIFIFSFQTITADVISLNSGGNTEIAITPDKYVEGFFSGISEEVVVTPPIVPPGGGGGGGGGGTTPTADIFVTPTEFNLNLAIDTTTPQKIRVRNLGAYSMNVGVSQQGLNGHVILENTSLVIPAGATVDLNVVFVALSEPGIFVGKILIGNQQVLVSLNVKTKLLLFDSNIVVLNSGLKVPRGEQLKTLVTLIPLGDPERLDVTLNFVVKDYTNKVYLTKSETLLVTNLTELRRNFDVGLLEPGDYIIGLTLVYPNGVAPSSAHFRVVEKTAMTFFGKVILFLIMMILIVAIFILIILIWRRRKKKDEEKKTTIGS